MTKSPIGPVEISIATSLLEAVAHWAAPESDNRPHLSQLVFRDGEVVATDGHRLVRVPIETHGLAIGLRRQDAITAVAAQDARRGRGHPDARFIAAASVLVPRLLDAVDALRRERDQLQRDLAAAQRRLAGAVEDINDLTGAAR